MHILISAVSSSRQPSGICRHSANLAMCLSGEPELSRVTLLVGPWQSEYFFSAFGLGESTVEVLAVDLGNNAPSRNWWYYHALPAIACQLSADVVHLAFPAPVRRGKLSCPLVCSLHDLYPYDSPRNFGRRRVLFNRIFLRQCLDASDAIVCSSNFTFDRLRQSVPAAVFCKATRVYQSVALKPDNAQVPERPGLANSPFLLSVAQHRRNKNLHLLISAFAGWRRKHPMDQRRLVIVGAKGPETSNLYSLVERLALQNFIRFESEFTDAELCWLYRRCDLMIVPSNVEGFCLPVVEALRCGSRVLCSDIPVLREIGGSNCRYFSLEQEHPASALAQAISEALVAPASVPFTSDRFSAKEIARQYVELYFGLAAGKGATTSRRSVDLNAVHYGKYAS